MLNKKTGLIALLAGFAASEIMAGTLSSFAVGDVLVCFRNSGGGANDLVVDAGQISTFTGAAANTRIPITQYTGSQLALVATNNVSWSAFGWYDSTVSPNWTLFVTEARTTLNDQTAPWLEANQSAQEKTAVRMATIPPGTVAEANYSGLSTATAVIEQDSSTDNPNYTEGVSYHDALTGSYGGNFDGYFQGNPENTTPDNFDTLGTVVRSDFYKLTPTSSYGVSGTWLGYFELSTNGAMTYVAYPSTTPVITSISRSGNTTTLSYTTGLYGTYTLRRTNSLASGTAMINWPAITTLTSGDTATHTITDTTTDNVRFYTITAQ